jgi:hypothetical protein
MTSWRRGALRVRVRAWTASIGLLVALVLLGMVVDGSANAAYPGVDGRIAFVRDGNIYTIQTTRAGRQQLTHGGHCSGPRWSPNGHEIAYLYRGNLWIMGADGTDKTQVTDAAPRYTDARPSWSPNGRYLAFVKTERGHAIGFLTRDDTLTRRSVTFSTPYDSESPTVRQVRVTALPDPVAWGWASSGSSLGSFILFEGAGSAEFCRAHYFCLDAIGRPHQDQYRNAFPSAEDQTPTPMRLLDPDWFPINPRFDIDTLTTQQTCASGTCTNAGLDLRIGSAPVLPRASQAVYSPDGRQIAYAQNRAGVTVIYLAPNVALPTGTPLTIGSQPDWQPLPSAV